MLLRIYKGCCNFFLTSCCKLNHRKYAHAHSSNSAACRRISYTLSYVRVALATSDVQSYLDIPARDPYRARNKGRSKDNVRTDCGFDWSNFSLVGHFDRSKFNGIENEINLGFLLFSCYLSSRCVLRNFDMKSWWHATRAVVYYVKEQK